MANPRKKSSHEKAREAYTRARQAASRATPPPGQQDHGGDPEPWEGAPIPLTSGQEAEAFPLEALPAQLQPFVVETARALNCPPDFVAAPMLGIAGGLAGNTRRLAITADHLQAPALYLAVIGSPGSGKSPSLDKVVEPVMDMEQRNHEDFRAALKLWQRDGEEGDKPTARRLTVDDVTTERLGEMLAENRRGIMMIRDEASALVTGLNQYKGGRGSDRQVFLKLWSQTSLSIDRKKQRDDPIILRRPFFSFVGGIQPDVVPNLRGESRFGQRPPDDGFLDRFLFAWPAELPARKEEWRTISATASKAWRDAAVFLSQRDFSRDDDHCTVWLGNDAVRGWEDFTAAHATDLNGEDFPQHLRGAWQKMRGYCGRLALIVHLLREAAGEIAEHAPELDGESLRRAVLLVDYFKSHTRKVSECMDADPRVKKAKHLLKWVRGRGKDRFSKTEAYQSLRNSKDFDCPEALDQPVDLLCQHRYLRPAGGESGPRGPGRPAAIPYEVHPSVLSPPNDHGVNGCEGACR